MISIYSGVMIIFLPLERRLKVPCVLVDLVSGHAADTALRVMTQARAPATIEVSRNRLPAKALPLMRSRLEGVQ